MKRILGMLICVCMAVVMLAACGTGNTSVSDAGDLPQEIVDDAEGAQVAATIERKEQEAETAENEIGHLMETYQGGKYTLTLTSHDTADSATGKFLEAFAAKTAELSKGNLTIEVHHNGELAGPFDSIDAVTKGDVDIAWGVQSFYDGKFPKTEVVMLPLLDIESTPQASRALWALYNTTNYLDDEYFDWHVLLLHCNCQTPIIVSKNAKVQPKTVDGFAGLNGNSFAGPPTLLVDQLSMNYKGIGFSELHDQLQDGTVDACLIDWHGVAMLNLLETASVIYDENMGTMAYFLLMNKDAYGDLPYELRRVIDTAADKSIEYTSEWDYVQDATKAEAQKEGLLKTFSPEEREKLETVANFVSSSWIERTADGQALYEKMTELLEKYK